jgi:hypothetical protein
MKTIKQIKADPRVYLLELNPNYDPEEAKYWPDSHEPKYFLHLNDGWVFNDDTHYNGADTVKELNELLAEVTEE